MDLTGDTPGRTPEQGENSRLKVRTESCLVYYFLHSIAGMSTLLSLRRTPFPRCFLLFPLTLDLPLPTESLGHWNEVGFPIQRILQSTRPLSALQEQYHFIPRPPLIPWGKGQRKGEGREEGEKKGGREGTKEPSRPTYDWVRDPYRTLVRSAKIRDFLTLSDGVFSVTFDDFSLGEWSRRRSGVCSVCPWDHNPRLGLLRDQSGDVDRPPGRG